MSNFVLTPNAVAKLRRAIAPRSGNTGAAAASGRPIDPDKFPPPFTVRWSASANDGAGAWVIWLPDKAQLVMLKDAYITPTGVTAEQALPTGWYTIDDAAASSTEVYLNITIPETGTASAEISTTQGQSTTGETMMSILVAEMETDAETGAKRVKQYVDSAALVGSVKDGESGADAGIYITQVPIDPSTTPDHPGGGVEITFQPTQDGVPVGQPTVVTLWNGSGGGGGGTDLSNTPALDVVAADGSAAGQASAGVAVTASRQDHVHKMPATVVLTDADQTITSSKTFSTSSGGLKFATANDNNVTMRGFGSSTGLGIYVGNNDTSGRILTASSEGGVIVIGGPSDGSYPAVRLGSTPSVSPSSMSSTTETRVPTLKWVDNNYQQKLTAGSNITISGNTISATQPTVNNGTLTIKQGTSTLGTFTANQSGNTTVTIPEPPTPPSGTVTFIGDMRWNTTTHTLQKRVDSLNKATGAVTLGTWSDITNGGTTPISSIITQSS
jgi:hypothetical protein